MDTRRTSSDRTGNRRCSPPAALVAACLVGAAWSASAVAAPSALDDAARDLPELATGDYTLEIVDLMGNGEAAVDTPDEARKVPYLFLTPRVAIILEDVFGDDTAPVADAATAGRDEQSSSTSPVAGNVEAPLSEEARPSFDHSAILPSFQRQMYRTDI